MLNRLPRHMPPLQVMLDDIGNPSVKEIARALKVHESTVRRWLRDDYAPHPVMLSVFWITRWGLSAVDCEAHNAAVMSAGIARSRKEQIESLEVRIRRLGQIATFGSANDPEPGVVPLAAIAETRATGERIAIETEFEPGYFRVDKTGSTPVSMRATRGLAEFEKMRSQHYAKTV